MTIGFGLSTDADPGGRFRLLADRPSLVLASLLLAVAALADGALEAHADTTTGASGFNGAVKTHFNTPATGAPTIDGVPQVGRTLTANAGTIADVNHLPTTIFPLGYEFRWVRVIGGTETEISGAQARTYTVTSNDVGSTLKVKVSFTDQGGAEETLKSAEVPAGPPGAKVAATQGTCPSGNDWCATLTAGYQSATLGASVLHIYGYGQTSSFGLLDPATITDGTTTYTVTQFFVSMSTSLHGGPVLVDSLIMGVTGGELPDGTVVNVDGTPLLVGTGTATSTAGQERWELADLGVSSLRWFDGQKVTVSLTLPPSTVPTPATGVPTIVGVPQVGQTLTAGVGTIADDNGLPTTLFPTGYEFQWVRVSGGTETEISSAQSQTYTVTSYDVGSRLKVRIGFTDRGGAAETRLSAAYPSQPPGVAVAASQGQCPPGADWCATLTAGHRPWTASQTINSYTFGFGDALGTLDPATFTHGGTEYTVTQVEVYVITWDSQWVTSLDDPNSVLIHSWKMTVTGGELPDGTVVNLGGTEFTVGTDSATSTVGQELWSLTALGLSLRWFEGQKVTVSAAFPPSTVLTPATGVPTIDGVPQVGQTLTANAGTIADDNGLPTTTFPMGYEFQWVRVNGGTETDIPGADQRTYDPASADVGSTLKVEVSFTDQGGAEETRPSLAYPTGPPGATVAGAPGDCPADNDWCATLTAGYGSGTLGATVMHVYGYGQSSGSGLLDPATFTHGTATYTITEVFVSLNTSLNGSTDLTEILVMTVTGGELPDGTVVSVAGSAFIVGADTATSTIGQESWDLADLGVSLRWFEGQKVTVSLAFPPSTDPGPGVTPLTVRFENAPGTHDGENEFTVEIIFSEAAAGMTNKGLRAAMQVSGGTAKRMRRVSLDDAHRIATIFPDGDADVQLSFEPTVDCADVHALCTAAGGKLEAQVSIEIPGPAHVPSALIAEFTNVPHDHAGKKRLDLHIVFSEPPVGGREAVRAALEVARGSKWGVKPLDDTGVRYNAAMRPYGFKPIVVTLAPTSDCNAAGALCTASGGRLEQEVSVKIHGPIEISVADARVDEGPDAELDFAVTLDRARGDTVHVDYATEDGSATAGVDYTATSGTLTFAAGETAKTVSVPVLDDGHDEDESLILRLSNPVGGRITDGEAIGTISNTDLMPKAWLGRFGRTAAEQYLEAAEDRFRAGAAPGTAVSVAGYALTLGDPEAYLNAENTFPVRPSLWAELETGFDTLEPQSRTLTVDDLVRGTAFSLTAGSDAPGSLRSSLWGRGSISSFEGLEGDLKVEGDVTSMMLGADLARGRWSAGAMLAHTRGDGRYQATDNGTLTSELTGLYPYGRYTLTDRVTAWGIVGYGQGTLELTPEGQDAMETDMDLMMGALGLRGILVQAPEQGGLELALTSDALGVRTRSEAVPGDLNEAEADAARVRIGLESTWHGAKLADGALTPRLELGLRHDAGDAETGFGIDGGGAAQWSSASGRLSLELSGRALLSHEADGFTEHGLAGTVGYDARPSSQLGLAAHLAHSTGASTTGGMQGLLERRTLDGLGAGPDPEGIRIEGRAGYGLPAFGGRFVATPWLGLSHSNESDELRAGWTLATGGRGDAAFELGLEGAASKHRSNATPERELLLHLRTRW